MNEIMSGLFASLIDNGGFTAVITDTGAHTLHAGYAVAMIDEQITFPLADGVDAFWTTITAVRTAYPDAGAFGGWVDGDTVYIDPVEIHADRDTAIRNGRIRSQLAIFNLTDGQEIRI